MTGAVLIIEAPDLQAARPFAEARPYHRVRLRAPGYFGGP